MRPSIGNGQSGPSDLVSIVINNFNYASYVGEAIDSALAQTVGNVEVVVVDDGSTDRSRKVIAGFGDRIVRLFKANGGQASCFNAGFEASRGGIVVFLDADDRLEPTAVEQLTELFSPGVVQAHWPLWVIDGNGERNGQLKPDRLLPEGDLSRALIQGGPRSVTNGPTSGNAWSRPFLTQVLPIPEREYRICADAYLYTLAPVFGEVRRSLLPMGAWRLHGENNYNGSREPLQQRLGTETVRYNLLAEELAHRLRQVGISASPDIWRERNGSFRRMERLLSAMETIDQSVPAGSTLVLVDDGDWSDVFWAGDELSPGRKVIRLYDGDLPVTREPLTDDDVVTEIERLRAEGASHVVFVWPGSWWLRHYTGLRQHLETTYRQVVAAGNLVLFDIAHVHETPQARRTAEVVDQIETVSRDIARIEAELRRREVVRAVRRLVHRTVPVGARVAVVSRGDDALVRLHEREGWHFPQTAEGVYAGSHPASDAEASDQLERLRSKGAEYLLFPSSAFWWLDHYADFRVHLESKYPKVAESDECLVFALADPSRRRPVGDAVTR